MTRTPGEKLGHYEIVALLGAGGMGEVYKATDIRLKRTVAIKVLSSELEASLEARERFTREAQTIAALNHPNIGVVYDIDEHDGQQFIVIEFIEGETLAERLKRGAMPLSQLLKTATEIADPLAKAHRQCIGM
jgi:serine/threonine protein kinase